MTARTKTRRKKKRRKLKSRRIMKIKNRLTRPVNPVKLELDI